MDVIRFGVIGFGIQGRLYSAILSGRTGEFYPHISKDVRKPANCALCAIYDRSEDKCAEIKSIYPDVATFTDWKTLITSGACDAVVITVPHYMHHEVTIYALEHGVHVLCEKPADVRASDVEEMIEVSEKHPELSFALMLNQRTNTAFSQVKELISSGQMGELRRFNWLVTNWYRPDSYYKSSPWRGTYRGEGGGILVNQTPHQLDLWGWFCGAPKTLYAVCLEGMHRDITVENDVTIVTTYENGATGSFISCTHDPLGTDRLEMDFSGGKIVVEDSSHAAVYRFRDEESVMNDKYTFQEYPRILREKPEDIYTVEEFSDTTIFGMNYVLMFENFASNVLDGTPLIASGREALLAVQLANAAQLSSGLGKQLDFPCDTGLYDAWLQEKIYLENK